MYVPCLTFVISPQGAKCKHVVMSPRPSVPPNAGRIEPTLVCLPDASIMTVLTACGAGGLNVTLSVAAATDLIWQQHICAITGLGRHDNGIVK